MSYTQREAYSREYTAWLEERQRILDAPMSKRERQSLEFCRVVNFLFLELSAEEMDVFADRYCAGR
jgi:hypothetical protein